SRGDGAAARAHPRDRRGTPPRGAAGRAGRKEVDPQARSGGLPGDAAGAFLTGAAPASGDGGEGRLTRGVAAEFRMRRGLAPVVWPAIRLRPGSPLTGGRDAAPPPPVSTGPPSAVSRP